MKGDYSIDEPEWADVSAEAKDLVKKLLTINPNHRPSALEAYNHPWIKKMASGDRVNREVAIKTLQNLQNFRVSTLAVTVTIIIGKKWAEASDHGFHRKSPDKQGWEERLREDLQEHG